MCNNNCCTCCQCGTHDDDTPQEITYTSVCNSDICKDKDGCRCCCCKNKGVCEDDPNVRLDGMEERMEECCEEVNSKLLDIECEIGEINNKNIELDEKIDDLYYRESLDFNFAKYNENTHELEFYHKDPENIENDVQFPESNINLEYFNKAEYIPSEAKIKFYHNDYHFENSDVLLSKGFTNVIFNENTTPRRLEFYYLDQLVCTLNAEPFLFDAWLRDVLLLQDGVTLRFTWNVDPDGQGPHTQTMDVDLTRLLIPIIQRLEQEILDRQTADALERTLRISGDTNLLTQIDATNTTISNLRSSINGYNPELPYDGTAVTVGLIDGKQFKVHLATFPELVLTVFPDYANNRFAVTTNKGNTNYVELKNSTYETIQHAANTYETINHASTTYETKVEAGNHYDRASINGRRIILTKVNGDTTPIDLPEDLLVKQNNCVDDAAIPVLLAYSSNPTSGTSAQAYYSGVTINPHTTIINGIADKAIKDDDGNNIADTYVSGGSFNNSNRNLTLVNPAGVTLATINIPDADTDTNKYVVSGAVNNNNQLTLTYNDGTTTQPIDLSGLVVTDHYVTSGTVTNGVLKLTRDGVNGTVDIQLPAGADGDHYPDTMSFNSTTGKLTLSGTNSTFSTLETTIPIPAADNTNPITDVLQNGDTVTFTYKDNTSESITVGGNTNVTYGGNTVTLLQAITSIENRLTALEGLWEINPNDSTQVVAKNNRSAKAAGFYDSTVNTV